jgi:hypothetical protein
VFGANDGGATKLPPRKTADFVGAIHCAQGALSICAKGANWKADNADDRATTGSRRLRAQHVAPIIGGSAT